MKPSDQISSVIDSLENSVSQLKQLKSHLSSSDLISSAELEVTSAETSAEYTSAETSAEYTSAETSAEYTSAETSAEYTSAETSAETSGGFFWMARLHLGQASSI